MVEKKTWKLFKMVWTWEEKKYLFTKLWPPPLPPIPLHTPIFDLNNFFTTNLFSKQFCFYQTNFVNIDILNQHWFSIDFFKQHFSQQNFVFFNQMYSKSSLEFETGRTISCLKTISRMFLGILCVVRSFCSHLCFSHGLADYGPESLQ